MALEDAEEGNGEGKRQHNNECEFCVQVRTETERPALLLLLIILLKK